MFVVRLLVCVCVREREFVAISIDFFFLLPFAKCHRGQVGAGAIKRNVKVMVCEGGHLEL